MRKLHVVIATLLTLAAIVSAVPKAEAFTCPIPQPCLVLEEECTCTGYYCGGSFHCAIPYYLDPWQ